jgi:hypothetical protein
LDFFSFFPPLIDKVFDKNWVFPERGKSLSLSIRKIINWENARVNHVFWKELKMKIYNHLRHLRPKIFDISNKSAVALDCRYLLSGPGSERAQDPEKLR